MAMTDDYAATEPARADIDALPGATLLEFGSVSCGWCIRAQSLLKTAFQTHPDVRHIKVEDGSGQPLGRSFGVKLWPTLVFLKDGREITRLVRPARGQEVAAAFSSIDPR
ncbi:MAG TPA: thioredoxin family protein [Steroidobacteraceae bacterium]|nr:thioredoxin family protein [Steroidobacteraceae bacterium]